MDLYAKFKTLISMVFLALLPHVHALAQGLPQAPTDDRAALAAIFEKARNELVNLENLMSRAQYQEALRLAKQSLDDVRIKSGIHPKASFREKINLPEGVMDNFSIEYRSRASVSDLSIDLRDTFVLSVSNHRGGYFLDILNLMKRTNLIYIQAFHRVLTKSGQLLDRDIQKIRSDVLDVHAIPLYLKDPKTSRYFLAFDFEIANSDQNYLFNRELLHFLLENRKIFGIKNEKDGEQLLLRKIEQIRAEFAKSIGGMPLATTSQPSERVDHTSLASANFKKCYDRIEENISSSSATELCAGYVKHYKFVDNPEFDSCYRSIIPNISSATAVKKCVGLARSPRVR